jgi:hypothetical protein
MESYSVRKKNEVMSFAGKWMELEIIMVKLNKPGSETEVSHIFFSYAESRLKIKRDMTWK